MNKLPANSPRLSEAGSEGVWQNYCIARLRRLAEKQRIEYLPVLKKCKHEKTEDLDKFSIFGLRYHRPPIPYSGW
jgi:hypothetical protein